ncbi:MAG: DUF1223 domain-containing protein [Rhodospirillales bacterium]|nr:DUF1223 domain-containing protein [Rhodospirillales bacterium]MSP79898.1 DUF1223 domain-containing protein [Rhodospirillales bacterium]
MGAESFLRVGRFILFALLAAPMAPSVAGAGERALTVVELFTSQGCSSCPPADEYLGELAERDDLLALSFHVDYWDYIGWKDPFANSAYTERQRQYRNFFNTRYVYTPQMVIQGGYQAIGSKRPDVAERIEKARSFPRLDVALQREAGEIAIRVAPAGATGVKSEDAAVWFVAFDERHQTAVARGENKGRQIVNRNVVRRFDLVGTWNGEAFAARVAGPARGEPGGDGAAVLVQSLITGRVLGAARLAPGG